MVHKKRGVNANILQTWLRPMNRHWVEGNKGFPPIYGSGVEKRESFWLVSTHVLEYLINYCFQANALKALEGVQMRCVKRSAHTE